MKANFGILPPLETAARIGKRDRGKAYAERALADITSALDGMTTVQTAQAHDK